MAGPQIVIEMDSDEAKLWAGFQRIMRGEEGMEKGMGKVAGETRKAAAEQAAYERAAMKVIQSVMTPQEKYNEKIRQLNILYGQSKLTVDQFCAALRLNGLELEKAKGHFEGAGQAGERSFGASALSSLGSYVTGMISISAALGLVMKGFQDMDAASEAAFNKLKGERAGMAELAGLAKTPEEAQGYIDNARKAYESGVGASEDEAAGLHYALVSSGLYEDRELFEALARSGVIRDVKPAVGATAKIRRVMGGDETGDATAVMSKLFQSADVTDYEVSDVARAVAEPALFASKLGMSDEELIAQATAAMQVLPVSKVDSSARAYYQALLQQGGFEGLSATEQMAKVKETIAPMSAEDQKKWFKSIEAQTFYEVLATEQGQKTVQEQLVALPEAERTRLAERKATLPDVDTGLRRARLAEQAKRRRETEDRPEGVDRALTEMIIEDRVSSYKARGHDWRAWVVKQAYEQARFFGGEELIIEGVPRAAAAWSGMGQKDRSAMDELSGETMAELARRKAAGSLNLDLPAKRQIDILESADPKQALYNDEVAGSLNLDLPAKRQIDILESGGATITPVTPVSAGTGADPQMTEQTAVLKEISQKLDKLPASNAPNSAPRPMPASSATANAINRE